MTYPCVLKPLVLSASRGVIRADDAAQFAAAFERIRGILQAADVAELGEGTDTILVEGFVPGGEVAAKTGTAQFGDTGNLQNHVWMIAIQGDLAVAVFVDVGDYGSTTAGPLLKSFLESAQG